MDLGCYRGLRHRRGLPVRGQRTHTNARTRKGPRKARGRQEEDPAAGEVAKAKFDEATTRRPTARRRPRSASRRTSSDGRRPHPVDVQQHDRHDHRRRGQRGLVVERRQRWASRARARATPFAAQVAAEDAAQEGRWSTACARVEVLREGPGRRPRVGAPRAAAPRAFDVNIDRDVTPDPAQRLPAAEAAPRLTEPSAAGLTERESKSMARYTGSVCRLCRREGMKLFLKGERCYTDKCAIERRTYPPGQHGQGRTQALGLRRAAAREAEGEAHLRRARDASSAATSSRPPRTTGITGETLLQLLERRLDNVVLPPGLRAPRAPRRASSCATATSWSTARKVNIPSFLGASRATCVTVQAASAQERAASSEALESVERRGVPDWLELDATKRSPARSRRCRRAKTITLPIQEQLIVELYSK